MIPHLKSQFEIFSKFNRHSILLAIYTSLVSSISWSAPMVEETFITATRIEQPLADIIGSVSIITAADIQIIQPFDLNDLLELEAGVDVVRSGGRGSQSSLLIRGTSSAQSLILVNGQRIASVSSGTANYALIPPELLSRVELVKGATSAVYGSDAIGAVVNAITYGADSHPDGVRISIDYGTHAYYRDAIAGNIKQSDVSLSISLNREKSDGIDNTVDYQGKLADVDADGYKKLGGAVALDYVPDANTRLSFLKITNSSQADYDANYAGSDSEPYSDSKIDLTQFSVLNRVNSIYKTEIVLSQSRDESETKDHKIEPWPSYYETKNINGSWINKIEVSNQSVILGYDFNDASIESTDQFVDSNGITIKTKKSEAGFVSLNGEISVVKYLIGYRYDDLKELGARETGSLGLSFVVSQDQQVYGKYAEGFRAPTLNDLYSPWGGNDQLQPEESEQYELGYKFSGRQFAAQLAIYKNNVSNLIEWSPVTEFEWRPFNIGEVVLEGLELTLSYQNDLLGQVAFNTDYLNATDELTNEQLHYRPKSNASFSWTKVIGRLMIGTQIKLQSQRLEPPKTEAGESVVNAGYGLINISSAYRISEFLLLNFKINNVFDSEYHLKNDYREDGRNILLGVRASF